MSSISIESAKLAIELDGGVHGEQWQYDESREKAISSRGMRVLRIPNEAMFDGEAVIALIREALLNAGKPNP